jgi:anti-sigma factor (TIGR02949 family)
MDTSKETKTLNCQEALKLLYEVIDQEASEIDENAIREHVERCRHCHGIFDAEKAVNDFIQAKLKAISAQSELSALRSRVIDMLDKVDCSGPKASEQLYYSPGTDL